MEYAARASTLPSHQRVTGAAPADWHGWHHHLGRLFCVSRYTGWLDVLRAQTTKEPGAKPNIRTAAKDGSPRVVPRKIVPSLRDYIGGRERGPECLVSVTCQAATLL